MILMYHRVLPRAELASTFVQPGMYVTPETFERHLVFLRAHFDVLPLRDLLRRWQGGDWGTSARYCAVTFDDGWLGQLSLRVSAAARLRDSRHDLPADGSGRHRRLALARSPGAAAAAAATRTPRRVGRRRSSARSTCARANGMTSSRLSRTRSAMTSRCGA
jgi:hypothetical protein